MGCACAIALYFFLARSRLGKSLRAAADNPEASIYMGIDVDRAHRVAFALGTAITALAGGLLATNYPFHPFVGLEYVIIMYAGVVLGGIGSVRGAFLASIFVGLVDTVGRAFLPDLFKLVMSVDAAENSAPAVSAMLIYIIMAVVLALRPQGLFPPKVR